MLVSTSCVWDHLRIALSWVIRDELGEDNRMASGTDLRFVETVLGRVRTD